MVRVGCCVALFVSVLFAQGCGGGGGETAEVPDYEEALYEVSDAASRGTERFAALFVEGATVPEADRKKYSGLGFSLVSSRPSGDTATLQVLVEDASGNELGTVEWTVAKENRKWKLQAAPLP